MKKRGQLQLSFSMIFSIFMIVAVIALAVYVIVYFLRLSSCGEIALFYQDLQKKVDSAYNAGLAQDIFSSSVPSKIKMVCFGNMTPPIASGAREAYKVLKIYSRTDGNVFMYPHIKACDANLAIGKIRHVYTTQFFCVPVNGGKVEVKIKKEPTESLAMLYEQNE
jgi:hypothetical protein